MERGIDEVVLPGDIVRQNLIEESGKKHKVIVGPGLRRDQTQVHVCKAGVLRFKKPNTFWVDYFQKRYVPVKGECVVGIVTNKGNEHARVDIGSSDQATLSYLAFEGATKKYKPDINIGDVVYAKVTVGGADVEPELVCIDSSFKKQQFGVLSDGFVFNCSLNLVYKILNPTFPLLEMLGKKCKFELAAGLNGRIWVKTFNCHASIILMNTLLSAEFVSKDELKDFCRNATRKLNSIPSVEMDTS